MDTLSNGIFFNNDSISDRQLIGTPTFPTSPSDNWWSDSYPVCLGKSKATDTGNEVQLEKWIENY